jgi:hypothetical protein
MRPSRHLLLRAACALVACAVVACAATGCSEAPSAPTLSAAARSLQGRWLEPAGTLQPRGSTRGVLTFGPDGRFISARTSFGTYEGQAPNFVSGWSQTTGTYEVVGSRITFRPDSLITWDSFSGTRTPTVQTPYPYGGVFDDCVFELQGDVLVLNFTVYPADAPVRARAAYTRAPGSTG